MIYHRIALPDGFGLSARLYIPGSYEESPPFRGDALSYDSKGAMLCWDRGWSRRFHRLACDMELMSPEIAYTELWQQYLSDSGDNEEFVWRWVVGEVLAKLHDTPIVLRIKQLGLPPRLDIDQVHDLDGARLFLTQRYGRALAFGFLRS